MHDTLTGIRRSAGVGRVRRRGGIRLEIVPLSLFVLLAACALPQEVSKTPRSAVEQLLLTHAVERALADVNVPLPEGATVAVEVSGLQTDRAHVHLQKEGDFGVIDSPSWDLPFVRDAVAARLYLDIYETATGRFVRSTHWTTGNAYYDQYTILFFFTFRTTDILQAP
ncbi:MAG: hypothetical protein AB1555_06725 [Nitrospirota bacterium]